jgi:hypothetical protein
VRKAKIAANEEKSVTIFTEKKVKDLAKRIQEMDKEMAQVRRFSTFFMSSVSVFLKTSNNS